MSFGGSLIRPEATGYGLIYFVEVRNPFCSYWQREDQATV
jgi:glutamate dehydrogenase/leucine dehydrogenase